MYLRQRKRSQSEEFRCPDPEGAHTRLIWPPTALLEPNLLFSTTDKMGKINTKSKWEKSIRFMGFPISHCLFSPGSKHGRRQIPGSRFKSFGAATKLIRCRRNFLKIQPLPTFSEGWINQAQTIRKTFVHANARSYKSYKRKQALCSPFIFHRPQMMTQSFILRCKIPGQDCWAKCWQKILVVE